MSLDQAGVGGVDQSIGVDITEKHPHRNDNIAEIPSVIYSMKSNRDRLDVYNAGKVDCNLPTGHTEIGYRAALGALNVNPDHAEHTREGKADDDPIIPEAPAEWHSIPG